MGRFSSEPNANKTVAATMDAFENELSKLEGLDAVKSQLRDLGCRSLELQGQPRKPPHFLFRGNRGTGKTMVGLMMGKLLQMVGIIPSDKVILLRNTDFDYGRDGTLLAYPETKAKIKEAEGGVLFVDNALPCFVYKKDEEDKDVEEIDYVDAKEELLSFMDSGKGVVVFAMRKTTPVHWDDAFDNRVSIVSQFDDFTCEQLAKILLSMTPFMRTGLNKIPNMSFKLEAWCRSENLAVLLEQETTPSQRTGYNAFMLDQMLEIAVDGMFVRTGRLRIVCELLGKPLDQDYVNTLTKEDLAYGLRRLNKWIQ